MKKNTLAFMTCLIVFSFTGFSQIKVNSSGYVGINNTSPVYRFDVNGNVRMGESSYQLILSSGTFRPFNSSYYQLGTSANRWSDIYGEYIECYDLVELSDQNLKKEVTDVLDVKKNMLALHPVRYKLNIPMPAKENGTGERPYQYGFLAQEVQGIFPDLINTSEDGTLGIRYLGFIPLLVQTVKEQQAEIDDLKARIAKLEAAGK